MEEDPVRRLAPAVAPGTTEPPQLGRLQAVLGQALRLNPADVMIQNLRLVTRSLARHTWSFDAMGPHDRHPLVLYIGQPAVMGGGFELQGKAQVAAAANGVPVARILAGDDSAETLGSPFLICERVAGESEWDRIVEQLDNSGRARLLRQCAFALAAIHRINASTPEPTRAQRLAMCRRQLDSPDVTTATFEWAFRWLTTHQPPSSPEVLVHGDYRMGNLLVNGSNLTAVLDWEWVHVGEACEDLAWFCAASRRFGAPASLGAGGLGSIASFLAAYEEASGTTVDLVGFHWWRVMAALFSGIVRKDQARTWVAGKAPVMGMVLLSRRVCETEWDVLDLLDEGRADDLGEPAEPPPDAGTGSRGWMDLLDGSGRG
jgi:aminoglycoside phosphotransferase (APT) family kinase protein